MLKPVTLACGHSGCQEYLAKLIRIEPNPKCPLCKQSVPSKATLNLNITLNDLTSQLEVRCTNSGCVWKGTYDSAEDHTNRCPKVRLWKWGLPSTDGPWRARWSSHPMPETKDSVFGLWILDAKGCSPWAPHFLMFLQTNFLPTGLWNNFATACVYGILQMQLTKNVNPEKSEFGTTLS